MTIDQLIERLEVAMMYLPVEVGGDKFIPETVELIRAARAAGFLTDDGEVRKVLGKFTYTEDGYIISENAQVWWPTMLGGVSSGPTGRARIFSGRLYSSAEATEAARVTPGGSPVPR